MYTYFTPVVFFERKNGMKRIFALLLTISLALSCLTACQKAPGGTEPSATPTPPAADATPTPAANPVADDTDDGDDDFEYEARAGEIIRDAENPAEMLGSAIMRNDKMVGTLGSFHTDMARIICDEYYPRNYSIIYPGKNNFLTIRMIQQESPIIKSGISEDNAKIEIYVPVSIEYVDAGRIENNTEESEKFCNFLENKLNEKAAELIRDSQNIYNADILGLGNCLKVHFWDMKEWRNWNWGEKYRSADIKVTFDVEYADFEEAD